ncbi:MAG: hypothetical protein V1859_03895 [archaeon]
MKINKTNKKSKNMKNRKSEVWVSAILYTLVATVALVLILEAGIPILERLKDRTTFTKTKEMMLSLDKQIQAVASEGEGSQRVVNLEIKEGKLLIGNNQVVWEFETKNRIIDSKTSQDIGNLVITSNANVIVTENDYNYFLNTSLKNDTFSAVIQKVGSESAWAPINTSKLIESINFNGVPLNGNFSFKINGDSLSEKGTGYTKLVPAGNSSNLGRAKVIAHINAPTFAEYDLEFTLESYADFISVKVKNFVPV